MLESLRIFILITSYQKPGALSSGFLVNRRKAVEVVDTTRKDAVNCGVVRTLAKIARGATNEATVRTIQVDTKGVQ